MTTKLEPVMFVNADGTLTPGLLPTITAEEARRLIAVGKANPQPPRTQAQRDYDRRHDPMSGYDRRDGWDYDEDDQGGTY